MALSPNVPVVSPGELITSAHINNIRSNLDRLDTTRLSTSGGTVTGQVVVSTPAGVSIVTDGHILVGTTAVGALTDGVEIRSNGLILSALYTAGTANVFLDHVAPANVDLTAYMQFRINQVGTIIGTIRQAGTTGVTYNTTSDARMKDVVGEADGDAIRRLHPVEFRWKVDADGGPARDGTPTGEPVVGFLAQEAIEVAPEAVSYDADDDSWQIDYGRLTPHLAAGLNAALDRIDALTARVAELEEATATPK